MEPLLAKLTEPAALLGYCLGGTLALAAASRLSVRRVATMATPWHFDGYPAKARQGFAALLKAAAPIAEPLGLLPMEVLQSAFWSLDASGVVGKFAAFAKLDPNTRMARDFVALEQWANIGEPLPWPAAKELAEALFGENKTAQGRWRIGDRLVAATCPVPTLHLVAKRDQITPAAAAPPGERWLLPTGHVGLAIGTTAREQFHPDLFAWLRRT